MKLALLVIVLSVSSASAAEIENVENTHVHVICPCSEPGAVAKDTVNFIELELQQEPENLNATGNVQSDGSLDLVKSQSVDVENDSVCVCKRVRKPVNQVRCTKPDLLHENCGERIEMKNKGLEIAPADKLYELYPDEPVPPAAPGKVFHNSEVTKAAIHAVVIVDKSFVQNPKNIEPVGVTETTTQGAPEITVSIKAPETVHENHVETENQQVFVNQPSSSENAGGLEVIEPVPEIKSQEKEIGGPGFVPKQPQEQSTTEQVVSSETPTVTISDVVATAPTQAASLEGTTKTPLEISSEMIAQQTKQLELLKEQIAKLEQQLQGLNNPQHQ